jgi:hypothetical protein
VETVNQAKDRAEELLQNLKKGARNLIDAESVKNVRAKIEAKLDAQGLNPAEARKRFDDAVSQLRLRTGEAKGKLSDYRAQIERRAEESFQRIFDSAQKVAKSEFDGVSSKVKSISKRFGKMGKKPEGTTGASI